MIEGRCLCGALRYEADPPVQFMVHCHCSMCRKHHGAAFATFVSVRPQSFRWISGEANVGVYASSENAERAFCRVCGSVAPHLLPAFGQVIIPAGVWQGSVLKEGGSFALLGTTMAPGFDFADYESGRHDELTATYPAFVDWIARLCRE